MEAILGTSLGVFIGITLIILGFAAYMTGQALAVTWRPMWHLVIYGALLGCVDRFLIFSLFQGELLSPSGYFIDTCILIAIAIFAYRFNQARKMASQYPWLYERDGLFGWRQKG
jgi:ABC-type uncharacterized transport system permease subunit